MLLARRLIFLLPLAAAACSSEAPRPAATTAATPPPPGGCEARFTFQNRSTTSVAEFYFRPAGASEWGPDRFGSRQLSRGQALSFRVVGPGQHDLRIVWTTGRESRLDNVDLCNVPLIVAENDRLTAPAGATQPAPAAPRGRSVSSPR